MPSGMEELCANPTSSDAHALGQSNDQMSMPTIPESPASIFRLITPSSPRGVCAMDEGTDHVNS
jgi:hypothetical protein